MGIHQKLQIKCLKFYVVEEILTYLTEDRKVGMKYKNILNRKHEINGRSISYYDKIEQYIVYYTWKF